MSQYYPPEKLVNNPSHKLGGGGLQGDPGGDMLNQKLLNPEQLTLHNLNRTINNEEYQAVLETFHSVGLSKGWLQDYDSHITYRPNFNRPSPFEQR